MLLHCPGAGVVGGGDGGGEKGAAVVGGAGGAGGGDGGGLPPPDAAHLPATHELEQQSLLTTQFVSSGLQKHTPTPFVLRQRLEQQLCVQKRTESECRESAWRECEERVRDGKETEGGV